MIVTEVVPPALDGERIDRVVAFMTGLARSAVADIVAAGKVTVDGRAVTTRSTRVAPGQEIRVDLPDEGSRALEGDRGVPVAVVYEDPSVIVIDKPAGMVVHPGAGAPDATLVHGLLARYPELGSVGDTDRPGIVHRLDAGTSGLLVVARTDDAYRALVDQLASRSVARGYSALALGSVEGDSGVVDAPVGRSEADRTRMAVSQRGREARTRYTVVRRFAQPAPCTLLECRLETGRTHQIRVHLAAIGHPIVGDDRYGGTRPAFPVGRPFLHAGHLGFSHPVSGEQLEFRSPLPPDLTGLLDRLS